MRYVDLRQLPAASARTLIINVATERVTTLAVCSAIRHAAMPVVVVNCTPDTTPYFELLMKEHEFDLVTAPLRQHGDALDAIFRETNDEALLLLDSDAEIKDPTFISSMRSHLEREYVFGAGFLNGPKWLEERHGAAPVTGLMHERPWIPCALFRVRHIRDALDAGASFRAHVTYNDFKFNRGIERLLAVRFSNSFIGPARPLAVLPPSTKARLNRATLPWLAWARREYYGMRPNFVWCDTGTDVFQYLRYQRQYLFAGLHAGLMNGEVAHYQGVTRWGLRGSRTGAVSHDDIEIEVTRRLRDEYGVDYDDLARTVRLG